MKARKMIAVAGFLTALIYTVGCYSRRSEPFRGPLDQRTATINNGEQKFNQFCDKCHPGGEAGLGPVLNSLPTPRFAKAFQIRHGLGAMPSFKRSELSKQDMWDITTYLKALRHNSTEAAGK
ncbi:MAG: cytochrome c [Saprospiraceae bacterium]|nr:cytochrome c [Saprospiraceae bacterium]